MNLVRAGTVLFDEGARYTLVRSFDAASSEGDGRALPRHEARWTLTRILSPRRGPEIGDAYRVLLRGPLGAVDESDLGRMRDALVDAVEQGLVLVYEARLIGSSTQREVEEGPSAPPPQAAASEQKTWIEIVLEDDGSPPKPVAYARYKIEVPDGSTREGILDSFGKARIDGIDPGTCQISFPSFDGRDWS